MRKVKFSKTIEIRIKEIEHFETGDEPIWLVERRPHATALIWAGIAVVFTTVVVAVIVLASLKPELTSQLLGLAEASIETIGRIAGSVAQR